MHAGAEGGRKGVKSDQLRSSYSLILLLCMHIYVRVLYWPEYKSEEKQAPLGKSVSRSWPVLFESFFLPPLLLLPKLLFPQLCCRCRCRLRLSCWRLVLRTKAPEFTHRKLRLFDRYQAWRARKEERNQPELESNSYKTITRTRRPRLPRA